MCKSLVRRVWMVALVLLSTAGVAASQMSPLPFQNTIAWGGPIQPPDVGSADAGPQTGTSPGINGETPAETSGDTPAGSTAGDNTNGPASNAASANPDNTIRQLGTPFPLQLQPQGLKIGPFYVPSVSDSFFYAVNSSEGQPTPTFVGNSIQATLAYSKPVSKRVFAYQAREQLSLSQGKSYLNQRIVASFTEQLTERWSLSASAQFTYFQNSILANPQYVLGYQNGQSVQHTLFVPQQGTNIYDNNNLTVSYSVGEKTRISFSPIIGATFQYLQGGWSNVHQFGGGVSITHSLTSKLSMSGFYSLSYSSTSGAASSSPNWVSQNIGVGFQGKLLQSETWSLGGSVSVSTQRYS